MCRVWYYLLISLKGRSKSGKYIIIFARVLIKYPWKDIPDTVVAYEKEKWESEVIGTTERLSSLNIIYHLHFLIYKSWIKYIIY